MTDAADQTHPTPPSSTGSDRAGAAETNSTGSPVTAATGYGSMEPWLREILRCPQCKGELADSPLGNELTCGVCQLAFPVENGVPVLLLELAHPTQA